MNRVGNISRQWDGEDVCEITAVVRDHGPTCLRWAVVGCFCGRLHVYLVLGHQLQLADLRPSVLNPLWHLQEMDNSDRGFTEVQANNVHHR